MPGTIRIAQPGLQNRLFLLEHEKSMVDGLKKLAHIACSKIPDALITQAKYFLPFMVDGTNIIIVRFRERTYLILGTDEEVERQILSIPIKHPKLGSKALISSLHSRICTFLEDFRVRQSDLRNVGLCAPDFGDIQSLRHLVNEICGSRDLWIQRSGVRASALNLKGYLVRPNCSDDIVSSAWGLIQVRDIMTS